MAYAPTLAPSTDANPSPRCLVTFPTVAPTAATMNVYRVAEGRQFQVRGGVNLACVGGAAVMDYEVPFGIPAVYRAEQFDGSGNSLGFTDTSTVTVTVTDTWIHQPLSPVLAVKAKIMMDSANDFLRVSPGGVVWPEGATVGRAIGGQRQGLSTLNLHVKLLSTTDADTLSSMFGSYSTDFPSVLCIRTPPPLRMPRVLFAACLQPHELIAGINRVVSVQMTADEVAPPAPGLVIPVLRREDIDAAYPTRAARAAAYATRIARDTDFTKSGLAGP